MSRYSSAIAFFIVCQCLASSQLALAEEGDLLDKARATIKAARYCALITLDDSGQPRARTVDPFEPDENFAIWMATRTVTRKVDHLRDNPVATLYYFDPETRSYVTLMGQAVLVDDEATKQAMRRPADSERFYPGFPDDYLLIRFVPDYLEAIVPGYRGDPDNWRPAHFDFQ